MLVNVSNHELGSWFIQQLEAARKLSGCGVIIDIPHPQLSPDADEQTVADLAWKVLDQIVAARDRHRAETACTDCSVHLMGQAAFCDYLNKLLELKQIRAVYSATVWAVVEEDGVKTPRSRFVLFRQYLSI